MRDSYTADKVLYQSYQTFVLVDEAGNEEVLHTDRDYEVRRLFHPEDTVELDGVFYVVSHIHEHGNLDLHAKHFMYFIKRVTDDAIVDWIKHLSAR